MSNFVKCQNNFEIILKGQKVRPLAKLFAKLSEQLNIKTENLKKLNN